MEIQKYLIHVDGIKCSSCVSKLEKLPLIDPSIQTSKVYFGESIVEVEAKSSSNSILNHIRNLGFQAQVLQNKAESFQLQKKQNRSHILKIGVAAFSAGNIMLFTIPLYSGLEQNYRFWFALLSAVLFLPILLYSALDFYKSAWTSLKNKNLSIDLPITIALVSGFVFSTFNLFQSHYDHLYYDSTASFILLILASRFLLARLQQKYVATYSANEIDLSDSYTIQNSDGSSVVKKTKEQILPNDLLFLKSLQTLPVEAVLETHISEWDLSSISGESLPKTFYPGMEVPSGAKLISTSAQLKAKKVFSESKIFEIQNKIINLKNSKTSFVSFMDKVSNYFIASVFTIAALFFTFYSFIDLFEAFQRTLALLIVACPCAIALGTPLAYLMGVYKAQKSGILIFKKDIFEKLLKVKNIFFDKTGTITLGSLDIIHIEFKNELSEVQKEFYLNLILNMENSSNHPIAHTLRKKFSKIYKNLPLESFEEVGKGVRTILKDKKYSFHKLDNASHISSELTENENVILTISFQDQIAPNSKKSISELSEKYKLHLLSGDNQNQVSDVSKDLSIPSYFSNQTPLDKFNKVKETPFSLMVGDGVNDSLALEAAFTSIAANGSVQIAADHSDAYLLKKGISQIPELIQISKKVQSTIYSNLFISFLYNITAGVFALLGYMNPLIAAILMPISSVLIFLNTLRGLR